MSNYQLLLKKLDEFIRKYYQYQLIRGGIYFLALFLASGLIFTVMEYYGHFSKGVRTGLFYGFLALNLSALLYWVGLPFFRLLQLGKIISHEEAARIIGQHFPTVKDKLLNTLQLHQMAQNGGADQQLINASVDRRIEELKPVPFAQAIDLGETKRYLKYAAIPLFLLLIISFISPKVLLDSTERLINHRTYYEEKAPFTFQLLNDSLKTIREETYTVKLKTEGNTLPEAVYVHIGDNRYRMNQQEVNKHKYTIPNVREDFQFQFEGNGFYSRAYQVDVLPQPGLSAYKVKLDYPSYTGKSDQIRRNVGDLDIPEGTTVEWRFKTNNTDQVKVSFKDSVHLPKRVAENEFELAKTFYSSQPYQVKLANKHMKSPDSIQHYLSVVPDAYPKIKVEKREDSLSRKQQFFTGEASDDYGLSKLAFHYKYTQSEDTAKTNLAEQTKQLALEQGQSLKQFYHTFDLNRLDIAPGDELTYYFEVWDNDAVNGPKSSRSQQFSFRAPTENELKEQMDETQEEVQQKLASASDKARELQKKLKKARQKLMNKDQLSWEDKQFVKETLKQQRSLQKEMKKLREKYQQNLKQQDEYQQLNEEMKEQYERMNEILKESTSKELQKEMDELDKLLDEEDKQAIQEQVEQMKRQNEGTQKQLERSLELYKQMALEQKMRSTAKELDELSKEQKDLKEETEKQSDSESTTSEDPSGQNESEDQETDSEKGEKSEAASANQDEQQNDDKSKSSGKSGKSDEQSESKEQKSSGLKDKQESLNKEFDKMDQELSDIEKLQKELDKQGNMDEMKKQSHEIQKLMQKSLQKLRQQQQQGASQQQQKAGEKMKKMAQKMRKKMDKMDRESLRLNYKKVRQLLENLIHFSKEQEELIKKFDQINNYNPQFVKNAQKQTQLKQQTKMIEDSLESLSQKVMQIESTVNREIEDINYYMEQVREYISDRRIGKIRSSQQYIMTATNNLAVLLSELMNQMQQQMASQMKGGQMCQNPKPGKKSGKKMGQIKQMQKKLGKQLKQLKKGKQSDRQGADAKDLARLQKMQQQIRQKMKEMQKDKDMEGDKESREQLKELEELMKENEQNIINNNVTGETIKRQQQINVKMLEVQEAKRTQGRDKQRKSQTAEGLFQQNPPELDEYKKERERQIELLQSVPPKLRGYYRMKVQEYFKEIQ